MKKSNVVKIHLHNHIVSVTDSMVVSLKHPKTCNKPCKCLDSIISYLEAELFVTDNYVVSDE